MTPKKQLATLKSLRYAAETAHEAYAQYAMAPGTVAGNKSYARFEKWDARASQLFADLEESLEAAATVDQRTLKRK